jgi:DNA-binding NarL/FixJ family response regulator
MYKFLDKIQRQELIDELKTERSRRYAGRIRVILLLDQKWTYKNIAEVLFINEGTIANYRK